MPYRDEGVVSACARHARAPSVAMCVGCAQSLCEPCVQYVGAAARCLRCARRVRRLRVLAIAAASTVIAGIAGTAAVIVGRGAPLTCDRESALAIAEVQLERGEPKSARTTAREALETCGGDVGLRWVIWRVDLMADRWGYSDAAANEATTMWDDAPYRAEGYLARSHIERVQYRRSSAFWLAYEALQRAHTPALRREATKAMLDSVEQFHLSCLQRAALREALARPDGVRGTQRLDDCREEM